MTDAFAPEPARPHASKRAGVNPGIGPVVALLGRGAARSALASVAGLALAIGLIAAGVAWWFGDAATFGEDSVDVALEPGGFTAEATGEGIWLALFMASVVIASIAVMASLVATYTKALVRMGATRWTLVLGHWAVVICCLAVAALGIALALSIFFLWADGAALAVNEISPMAVRSSLRVVSLHLLVLIGVVVFLRFPWWVGSGTLLLWVVVLPAILDLAGQNVPDSTFWLLVEIPLLLLLHWLLMRRLPVR